MAENNGLTAIVDLEGLECENMISVIIGTPYLFFMFTGCMNKETAEMNGTANADISDNRLSGKKIVIMACKLD